MGKILKLSFLLMALAGSLFTAPDAFGQEQEEPWRKDWQKFGEAIAPYAREGIVERKGNVMEFNRIFSKEVEWTGTLRKFYSNGVAKYLSLEMQPIQVPLLDGSIVEVSELSIWCGNKRRGCDGWSAELIGKQVIFRTELINRTRGNLPVVRLEFAGKEDQRIQIETYGAELIKVVSK